MKNKVIFLFLMLVLVIIAAVAALKAGSVDVSWHKIFNIFCNMQNHGDPDCAIIGSIRLPRIIYAILVGGMLGASGAILQALFRNPLVDPFITGISSGAALGAAIGIIAGMSSLMTPSVLGAVLAILFVYRVSNVHGSINVNNLLLTGVMTGSMLSAVIMLLNAVFSRDIIKVVFWLMGDLSSINLNMLLPSSIFAAAVIAPSVYFANDLNIISSGEETAGSLGVNTERIKLFYFLAASILTGLSVALSGVIGFVGLIVPHIMRRMTGPDMRILIPASFLGGALFLLLSDTVARTVFLPGELPAGIITGLIGAPVFIYILAKDKRK
jgi:iron complex transport system permease protein